MRDEMFGQVVNHRARSRHSMIAVFASLPGVVVVAAVGWTFFTLVLPMPVVQAIEYVAVDIRLPSLPALPARRAERKEPTQTVEAANAAPLNAPDRLNPEVQRVVAVADTLPIGEIPGGELPPTRAAVAEVRPVPPPAPSATNDSQRPVAVADLLRAPTPTNHVSPVYPSIARSARVQGVVIIEATIGINGAVLDAKILRSIPLLDAAAIDAVRQWRFTPTLLNGQPVPVIMTVTVNFVLQ
jgi:protein TonB